MIRYQVVKDKVSSRKNLKWTCQICGNSLPPESIYYLIVHNDSARSYWVCSDICADMFCLAGSPNYNGFDGRVMELR